MVSRTCKQRMAAGAYLLPPFADDKINILHKLIFIRNFWYYFFMYDGITLERSKMSSRAAFEFRRIPALQGQPASIPLKLNNPGWAPLSGFIIVSVVAGLAFAATAEFSRKETVVGFLNLREGTARMAAPRPGTLTALMVGNGDLVAAGTPLFTVDTSQGLQNGGTLDAALKAGLQQQITLLEEQTEAEGNRIKRETDRLTTQIQGATNQLSSLDTQRKLQVERASVMEARLKALQELRAKGYVSEAEFRAREETWLGQRQGLAAIDQQMTALATDLTQARIDLDRAMLDSADRLSRLSASKAELRQRLAEVAAQGLQILRSPVAGRVTALQATVGQRLDPVRPVLVVVPENASLRADLFVPSSAIGFVEKGQQVRLMYDAFPYQHFGAHGGVVEAVSETMLTPQEVVGPLQLEEPTYQVSVRLDRETIDADLKTVRLQADMTVRADIILERRTLLQWVLESLKLSR